MAIKSPYTDYEYLTSKHSGKRTQKVRAFVIHHMAGVMTGKQCAQYFQRTTRQSSCNYCIGPHGDVALNVGEENRAWTSSSNWADQRAITYELSNSKAGGNWHVNDATIDKLILMLAEQHQRYGLKKCTYTGDTKGTLWKHQWFANTNCPGPYLGSKFSYIAAEVNKKLQGDSGAEPKTKTGYYRVRKSWQDKKSQIGAYKVLANAKRKADKNSGYFVFDDEGTAIYPEKSAKKSTFKPYTVMVTAGVLNVRAGAGMNYKINRTVKANEIFTIVEEKSGWGKLKSGAGWISLAYTKKTTVKTPPKVDIDKLAREVIAGKHGNGEARKKSLGSNYSAVQKRVNELLG